MGRIPKHSFKTQQVMGERAVCHLSTFMPENEVFISFSRVKVDCCQSSVMVKHKSSIKGELGSCVTLIISLSLFSIVLYMYTIWPRINGQDYFKPLQILIHVVQWVLTVERTVIRLFFPCIRVTKFNI